MKRRVYVETSVISYLASRPSRDVVVAGRQQLTHLWRETRRSGFELVISQVVLDEVRAGDPDAAERRPPRMPRTARWPWSTAWNLS